MADGKARLSKEHCVDSYGHLAECSIHCRGCTGKWETQSRIGSNAITPLGGRLTNYNKMEKEWKDRDH